MLEDPENDASTDPELDRLFDALSHRHRRRVLRVLRTNEGPMTTEELARNVVAMDGRVERRHRSRERVRTELHHRHVPKMAAAGLVDADGETVELAGDEVVRAAMALLERVN